MSIRSVHSRRTVPTQRSAKAFALGACGGVRSTSISAAVNTVSKRRGELRVPVTQQEPQPVGAVVETHQQVPCLLRHPGAAGMGGDAEDVDLAGGELDEEQDIDPFEEHGVNREEVTRQDRSGLGS